MKAPSLPSLRSMILSMEEEKKKMCFLIILLLFFSPSIAIMRPYSLIKLTGVLFSDFFLFVFWVLSAVSSFTHTKTRRKKNTKKNLFLQTHRLQEKLSMGKEHGLVFGAQSRNDIFVVMIHCRRMVNVIFLHENGNSI